jgi:hypothetical protein
MQGLALEPGRHGSGQPWRSSSARRGTATADQLAVGGSNLLITPTGVARTDRSYAGTPALRRADGPDQRGSFDPRATGRTSCRRLGAPDPRFVGRQSSEYEGARRRALAEARPAPREVAMVEGSVDLMTNGSGAKASFWACFPRRPADREGSTVSGGTRHDPTSHLEMDRQGGDAYRYATRPHGGPPRPDRDRSQRFGRRSAVPTSPTAAQVGPGSSVTS